MPNLQRGFSSTMGVRHSPSVYLSEADTGGSKHGQHLLSLKFVKGFMRGRRRVVGREREEGRVIGRERDREKEGERRRGRGRK